MKMKNLLILLAAAMLMWSCSVDAGHKAVKPLPPGYSTEKLADCTVPAMFTSDDLDISAGTLAMTVFSEDLYDAVDVQQMQAGDTLVFQGRSMVVSTIENGDGLLTINGGIEQEGACLQPAEGGTYRGMLLDDHSVYTQLGKVTLPVASSLVIVDCGEEPDTPSDTISTDAQRYLAQAKGWRRDFSELNTKVLIENGTVTGITRRWIP